MMTLIPATLYYTDKLYTATILNPSQPGYAHYVNIIVLAEYYQPSMIFVSTGGVNSSLDGGDWVPLKVGSTTEAYAIRVKASEGVVAITHSNPEALMTANVYGFANIEGYGHSARRIDQMKGKFGCTIIFDKTRLPHTTNYSVQTAVT